MSNQLSRFEEIIGDIEAFRLMLEGAFKDWAGSFEVLLADSGEYLLGAKNAPSFQVFCHRLRGTQEGDRRCLTCDQQAAQRAAEENKPIQYKCHAGLLDFAVPVVIDGRLTATIFFGQVRPSSPVPDQRALNQIQQLESDLGLARGDLMDAWNQVPRVAPDMIDGTVQKLWKLVVYITRLGHERLELRESQQRNQRRFAESEAFEQAARNLGRPTAGWDEFWARVSTVLEQVAAVVGANCGLVLASEQGHTESSSKLTTKAVCGLPVQLFIGRAYSLQDQIFHQVVEEGGIEVVPFRGHVDPSTVCSSIQHFAPSVAAELDQVVLVRLGLADNQVGALLLFLSKARDVVGSLSIEEEKGMLTLLASLIGAAHNNCRAYQRQEYELELRHHWLQQVAHQLLGPLHGLQQQTEGAARRLVHWQAEGTQDPTRWPPDKLQEWQGELARWEKLIDSMVESVHYVARLVDNLTSTVRSSSRDEALDLATAQDVAGLLIRCARNLQGIALERGQRLTVEMASFKSVDGKLCIDERLFQQAVGNLIDNAVKYSGRGTEIVIRGEISEDTAKISIVNCGIRLHASEVEEIFDEGYRTKEARRRHPTGIGIGLTVARQIIQLHKGSLTAQPSTPVGQGWETAFDIVLPFAKASAETAQEDVGNVQEKDGLNSSM